VSVLLEVADVNVHFAAYAVDGIDFDLETGASTAGRPNGSGRAPSLGRSLA